MRNNQVSYVLFSMTFTLPPSQEFHDLSFQEELFFRLLKKLPQPSREQIIKGYALAQKAHIKQRRDDGTPYILHPLRATICLMRECDCTDPDILTATLLHDVVEDTHVTIEHIRGQFGERVASLVGNVTRERPIDQSDESIRTNKAEKFTWLMTADEQTRLIKCTDLLDNVRSWPNIPKESNACTKFPRWFQEVKKYGLPLAEKTHKYLFDELERASTFARNTIDINSCVLQKL